jgi:hypothetical protein
MTTFIAAFVYGGGKQYRQVILGRVRMVTVCEIYVEPGIVCIPSAGSSIYSQLAVEMLHSNTASWIKYISVQERIE